MYVTCEARHAATSTSDAASLIQAYGSVNPLDRAVLTRNVTMLTNLFFITAIGNPIYPTPRSEQGLVLFN